MHDHKHSLVLEKQASGSAVKGKENKKIAG